MASIAKLPGRGSFLLNCCLGPPLLYLHFMNVMKWSIWKDLGTWLSALQGICVYALLLFSLEVMSNSLQPPGLPGSSVHGILQARIRECCHFLLQGIFPALESNSCLLHWQADSLPLSYQGSLLCDDLWLAWWCPGPWLCVYQQNLEDSESWAKKTEAVCGPASERNPSMVAGDVNPFQFCISLSTWERENCSSFTLPWNSTFSPLPWFHPQVWILWVLGSLFYPSPVSSWFYIVVVNRQRALV